MAITARPQQLHGVTITGSSGFMAWILSVDTGVARGKLETTNSATTGYKTFRPEQLAEAKDLKVSLQFNSSTAPPITAAEETWTITWPMPQGGATAATLAGTGFLSSFDITGSIGSIMTATATVSWSGTPTFTAAT